MKQLLLKYLSNYDGGFNHRNALRYLYKREPDLWQEILDATPFLDKSAKPKQRCWHILNDVWEHPRCPVTNKKVRWFENRYLTYISIKAQMLDPNNQKKRQKTMMEKYGVEHALQSKEIKKKRVNTYINTYGVKNAAMCNNVKKKIRNKLTSTGRWRSDDELTDIARYKRDVHRYTEQSWREHYDKINPNGYERGVCKYHIDHRYPQIKGFEEGIAAEIIGHWTNLQLIHYKENLSKHRKTPITKEQLLEEYDKYTYE